MYTLVLFRNDLRTDDNPALAAAAREGLDIIPLYVFEKGFAIRRAADWGRLEAVRRFRPLCLRSGDPAEEIFEIAKRYPLAGVYMNRRYVPAEQEEDARLKKVLKRHGLKIFDFEGNLLFAPSALLTRTGGHYRRFTPFYRRTSEFPIDRPSPATAAVSFFIPPGSFTPPSVPDWAKKFAGIWTLDENEALKRLRRFDFSAYERTRDFPALETSRLSPYLSFGLVSIRRLWATAEDASFRRQLIWREFNAHLLASFKDLRRNQIKSTWYFHEAEDDELLERWKRGETGEAIVDAGMRELWETGYMHNRVRMVAASWLIHNMRQPWRRGEEWFMRTLLDADEANNPANWQWAAGCGANGSPVRPFSPTRQEKRFDPAAEYIGRWKNTVLRFPRRDG